MLRHSVLTNGSPRGSGSFKLGLLLSATIFDDFSISIFHSTLSNSQHHNTGNRCASENEIDAEKRLQEDIKGRYVLCGEASIRNR